ncbi:MOSC domain-containing protein [Aliamphritea hakodatensis]|uniref:MOSC domain-containing protein n=1 Tax=Aliamphritea hakodatensis TaxID=2895352 RepID=UPI0022FD5B02|nr:MOSC domain-containing protein [Aliamphritea hakodatensis]
MKAQKFLFGRFVKDLPPGELSWIGLRPGRKQEMTEVPEVQALETLGLEGDHRCEKTPGSGRQVTIISEEYIQMIRHFTGLETLPPGVLRRNLVVKNINLTALRHQQFTIGDALFEATALCHPCSRMETALGKGGVAAMLGHGGLCAKILRSGTIRIGDAVIAQPPEE